MKQLKCYYTPFITTLFLLLFGHGVWGQVTASTSTSLTSSSSVSEQFANTSGANAYTTGFPTSWSLLGSTSTQTSAPSSGSTAGGWYAGNDIGFLGSGSVSNGNATWRLQNNTNSQITGFSLSLKAKMYKSNSGTPSVLVYYSTNSTGTIPSQGATGFTAISSLTIGDVSTFSSTVNTAGVTLTTSPSNNISGLTIANSNYIYIRFIFSGGSNSDLFSIDDITITPILAVTSYSVTFDANGGSGSMTNQTASVATALSSNLFTRSGYSFVGWNTAANGSGTSYTDGASYSFASNVTLYAQWQIPTWTGATSTDWNTASNWSPAAVPTSTDNVIIPSSGITNFPVVSGLTIDAGKTVTLNSNTRLTVNGNIVNNGTLTLQSGATLVQGTGNTASGTGVYNVQQALTGAGGPTPSGRFWYMGSPLSGATSTAFDAAGDNKLWTYAEATQTYSEITTNGVTMSPIQGHVARLGASSTINFTGGVLNSGDYTNNSLTNTGTGSTRGYTLLSNPYPSYLDWTTAYTTAVATNVNLSSSIWYRSNDGTNMVYDIYNATGAIATTNSGGTTTQYIPPMQAFWVYNPNDGTTGSVTFSNSMRSHQNNGGLKSITDFPAFLRLNLENDGAIDQTVLYFDNNAKTGYDNFDSDKMMVSNAAQVYSFVDNKKLAINGMKSVKANKQVPLTVEFPTTKSYAFNATEVAMIDGMVILEDRLMNVFQDLTMNPVYAFDAVAGTDANRFVVHFQANGGVAGIETAEENGIDIVSNATGLVTISLSEELPATGTIHIIDINGKVIATQAINEQTTTMNINAATGVYHVLVDSSAKVARKKIVITK
jgi:uncharacterized repeat protein (TIGR02543 family)